jgi:hypothetical protein
VCPPGARARHPAFDVTPAAKISAIITEVGVLRPPFEQSIAAALAVAAQGGLGATAAGGSAVAGPAAATQDGPAGTDDASRAPGGHAGGGGT